jgi:hypothetical protein
VISLLLSLTAAWNLSFPGENDGFFDARRFFQPDADHFIYSLIEDDVTLVKYGPVSVGIGLSVETFMGKSSGGSDTAFNVYGAHWNIRGSVGVDYRNLLFTLFTDHECFHNIDMADTCGQYMNNLKLGVENSVEVRMEDRPVFLPAGPIPQYTASIGVYRPQSASFQKGHNFDWSLHGELNYPLLSAGQMVYGGILHSDLYFHLDGGESSRYFVEVYGTHHTENGDIVMFFRNHFYDSQPIRSLQGETCFGMRFEW